MEAKDTVLKAKLVDLLLEYRKAGIREVVEWIRDNLDSYMGAEFESVIWEEDWQAQQKEWGI